MANVLPPYRSADCYVFPYPESIEKKTGLTALVVPIRDLFDMMARDIEKNAPKQAALYREAARHYNHCDKNGYSIDRDGNGAILVDYDDWDELTNEQRILRGNRNATIAVLDRLRFHLEMMSDSPENNAEVNEIRRTLGQLIEPLTFA